MSWHLIPIGIMIMILAAGCSGEKAIKLPGLEDDIINKSQIADIESKMTREKKIVLEKESLQFSQGDKRVVAIGINNILPMKKEFRVILSSDDPGNMLTSESTYSIIEIKSNDFEIIPLVLTMPEVSDKTNYKVDVSIEYKEEGKWNAYDQKSVRLT